MTEPKVSILVPVYNVSSFIERCAISVFEQSYNNIEYIFINDCTADDSIEILNKVITRYPNRSKYVKIINHVSNKGLAAARNTGVENATGEYLLHVDSDDFVEKDAIESLVSLAIKENADLVMSDFYIDWFNRQKIGIQIFDSDPIKFVNLLVSSQATPSVWNKLIRTSLYKDYGVQNIEGINYGEDFYIMPQLVSNANRLSKIDKPLYHYMQTNPNSYTQYFSEKNIISIKKVFINLEDVFSKHQNSKEILQSIEIGKSKKKIEMINFAKIETLKSFDLTYFDTQQENKLVLDQYQTLLLNLYNTKNYRLLEMTRKTMNTLKTIIKKIM